MSAPKRDFHAKARAGTPVGTTCLRGNSQDRSSACRAGSSPGSVPTLPPLSCLSPAFMGEPPPGNTLSRPQSSQPADLSVLELPQLVAKVGPEVAIGESMWMEGPCLVASALAVDIPLKVTEPPQGVKSIPADDNIPVKRHAESEGSKTKKESKTKHSPQTGFEVFEIFARKRHLGELEFYYLKASEEGPYRPYDLQVVPPNKAGSNHYIFSPTTVMHVQNGCSVGILTLAEWYREGVLWKALRDIPFFRNYLLRKSFRWWKQNVCRIVFQRKREILHSQLLMAVPQFREALFHVTRLLEELKNVHWLPQDVKRTYTLLEFQNTLLKSNQESQGVLKRFLHYRTLILDMVQETSYKLHQDLQHQLETQLNQCSQPIHLQHASTGSLSKKLHHTEQALQRLGNVAALIDCMIVQSLVTISNHETMDFLNKVLKREQKQQGSLFQADLIFGAEGHLTLFPPMHLFQEVLLGALLSIGDSFLHVFDSCNNSPDSKDSSTACLQDLSPSTGLAYKETAPTSVDSFRSIEEPCVPSSTNLVLPKRMSLRVQGQRVRGQFYPQSRKQLEWHLHLHARTQETEKEQARITQEAHQEVLQLFELHSWLVDTHLFTTQWNRASLEGMHGQPALKYKEHIQKVHSWRDRVCAMPPAFTTSNKLLAVTCFHIQDKLVPLLTAIEEDSLKLISEELQLHSDNLAFELKSVMERLRREPTDLADFTDYAGMVKRYKDMSADMLQQLDHIHSLQEIIHLYCRNMSPGGNACMEQIHHLWIQFVPLLKQAANTVKQKLPSMTDTLDSTVSSLTKEIEDLVCRASTGLYLDPNQSADQMIAELRIISRQFDATSSQLNELSRSSQSLRGFLSIFHSEHPLDLTFVTTAKQNIEARNGLWELKRVSTSQIQEWSLMLFSKFVVYKAQEKVSEWLQETDSIAKVIPPHDAVLQETLHNLERFNQQLSILAKLSSSTLKYKHWRNIFKGMGLSYDLEQNLTVADLMSKELLEYQHKISKICREAKASVDMEHVFRRLQLSWERTEFRLAKFIVTVGQTVSNAPQQHSRDSGTFTIMDLEMLLAQTEDSIMTLLSMLFSPHAAEFKREAEHWVQLLQELEELLDFCERYQQKWIFLSKMFYETSVYTQQAELVRQLLTDIHECLSVLQMNTHQRVQEVEDHKGKNIPKTRDEYFTSNADMKCKVLFEGKNISANPSFGFVIISSNGYSAEIPENLRVASRPVSLMQPDYKTIAEILLVCLGFSEASSMSRRLVTLFNLAKDSFCLPNFVVQDQSSWLVLLKKVIHASGIHLYNSFKKTDEDRFLVLDGQIPVDFKGSAKMPQEFSLCKCTSKSFICNSVREEQAIIKGVMFALLPAIIEHKKALQFRTSFEQIFPMARSFIKEQFIEESKENLLRNAFTNELDRMGLYADTQMLHNALTLYQTLAFSKAVVLVGPAGSGKTTIYQALAGALRGLATESVQPEFEENTSCWCSVNTVVLFPNAFSPEELFGGCVKQPGSCKDGAFTKVLRDTKTQGDSLNNLSRINPKKAETRKVKWLILDGEPLSQPGWFDSLSTLVDPRESFLCLSSGETVQLSQEDFKVIVETTTLRDSTPSVLAHCSLVYVSGKDLWRAVWKGETDALYRDHTLDQSTVNMWSCLAEDLFSRTLIFLRRNALTTVMSSDGDGVSKSSPGIVDGLQELFISLVRTLLVIFFSFLQDTGPEQFPTELQARNLFVVAYIWGFGGQLHPRHWPQFDILAREALFDSRYQIEVPSEGTVFEHFFSLSDGMLEDNTNAISVTRIQKPLHSHTSVPQTFPYKLECRSWYWYFRNKQRNLHMFLLLPLNKGSAERLSGQSPVTVPYLTKVLSLSFCVEVYQPWSSETLVEIASDHLKLLQIPETVFQAEKTLVASMAQVMAGIHQSAIKYASTFLNMQPFSLQTYFELMTYFYHLCGQLCEQGPADRVATVLARVKDMTDTAQEYSQQLFRLQAKFDKTQKWLNQLQRAVDTERTHCERARQQCLLEKVRLSHLDDQLELVEQQARDALNEVSPLYQAALKALQSLNQSDLDEVRHYRNPPDGVVTLMNAICMLFNRPCNWESSKQLLGQPNFLQELEFFDRSHLNNELFQKLGQVVMTPNLQPHLVRDVSRACESLSCWLQALYQYACAQRHMAPQEAQKNSIIKQMAESRKRLRLARLQEEATQNKLEDMETQEQLVRKDLEDLAKQLHKVEAQKKEAADAINKLSCFTDKWIKAYKEAEIKIQTISGDALLLASVIAYLGPFGPDLRLALLEKWHKVCLTGRLDISPEDPQGSLLGKPQNTVQEPFFVPIPVAKELHQAMAQAVGLEDSLVQTVPSPLVLELLLWGLRVPWAHHWALLVDTQQQLTDKFPRNGLRSHKEKEYELVVSVDDPTFLHKLRHGAEKGWRVLVTHIEHAIPIKEFLDILVRPAGSLCLDVFHPPEQLHSEFRLSISTALPVKVLMDEIHPSVLEKVKVIDLSLSTSEVQDIIMTSVLQAVCPDLWVRHCQAKTDKQALQDKLHLEEASLMNFMLQSSTPLLQDPEFIPHVLRCQSTSLKLQTEIEALSSETDCFKPLLNEFHRIAVLATDLYKALQQVEQLSPFYSFPLHNYLFALREALTLKGHQDSTRSGDIISCAVMSEMSQRVVSHVLAQYRLCLLQSHAEVLRLLVSVAFLKHNEGCSETERVTFLKGIQDLESTEYVLSSEQSMEIPSWIPQHIQADVCLLEKIPPFHGLVSSLRNSSRQWQEYLRFPSSTVIGPVPCQSHYHLTTLQRAILWKTFFPQWLAAVADDLAASQQGQSLFSGGASGPCTSSPEALSHFLSRNEGPVIVTLLSQSKDEPRSIHPLYWIKQVAQYQADKKGQVKVTVISFESECQRGIILSALDTAVQTGHWLVLNNCHLLDHWDPEVVTQLKQLMFRTTRGHLETVKGGCPVGGCAENHVHPHFRLWFITKDNVPLSVPAVVRTGAVHLVCDSYWDLRDELCSSMRQVMSTVVPATSSAYAINPVEPLVRCVILHSVMLQRQKLKYLGQGSIYNWTQEDLHTLVDAQVHITKHCRDYTAALEYIAAYLIYGGHVSDSADLKAVEAVCRACLRPEPDMRGSGPHTLSEMITTRYFGEKDLLKSLEHCMQTSLNSNDCGVLGFSAAMTSEMVKVKSHRLGILLLQSQGGYIAVSSAGVLNHLSKLTDYRTAQERLQALQENLCYSKESMSVGVSLSPLHTFLQTEWECLLEEVSSLLAIFQPPQDPSAPSYVASSTISKLETRAHLLRSYQCMEFTRGLCHVYCLSAFANPRGFLAALIKETVDTKQQDISRVFLHYQVLAAAVSPAAMPSSGVCLSGLELHGALWDTRLGVLQDTLSSKPCPLPLIWVRAQERDSDSTHSNSSCSMPLYNCPLYVDSKHEDEEWSLSDVNIVTHVPLMTRLHPVLCSLRRVRLVSTLQQNRFKY
ncbi:hypothetical protein NFI96_014008 [Prochilodus magdalenae]|nr:hypothetical protein NFI96_014008 [Prochilodus magdalenae]